MAASIQTANDIVQGIFYAPSPAYICSPLDFRNEAKITERMHDIVAHDIVLWRVHWMRSMRNDREVLGGSFRRKRCQRRSCRQWSWRIVKTDNDQAVHHEAGEPDCRSGYLGNISLSDA
jgi:hypothetical protein